MVAAPDEDLELGRRGTVGARVLTCLAVICFAAPGRQHAPDVSAARGKLAELVSGDGLRLEIQNRARDLVDVYDRALIVEHDQAVIDALYNRGALRSLAHQLVQAQAVIALQPSHHRVELVRQCRQLGGAQRRHRAQRLLVVDLAQRIDQLLQRTDDQRAREEVARRGKHRDHQRHDDQLIGAQPASNIHGTSIGAEHRTLVHRYECVHFGSEPTHERSTLAGCG